MRVTLDNFGYNASVTTHRWNSNWWRVVPGWSCTTNGDGVPCFKNDRPDIADARSVVDASSATRSAATLGLPLRAAVECTVDLQRERFKCSQARQWMVSPRHSPNTGCRQRRKRGKKVH